MLKYWNIINYIQTETVLNMPFWFICFYRINYVNFVIECRLPRPNRFSRLAPPAPRKLTKFNRKKPSWWWLFLAARNHDRVKCCLEDFFFFLRFCDGKLLGSIWCSISFESVFHEEHETGDEFFFLCNT